MALAAIQLLEEGSVVGKYRLANNEPQLFVLILPLATYVTFVKSPKPIRRPLWNE